MRACTSDGYWSFKAPGSSATLALTILVIEFRQAGEESDERMQLAKSHNR
jgi:hypothetical protein